MFGILVVFSVRGSGRSAWLSKSDSSDNTYRYLFCQTGVKSDKAMAPYSRWPTRKSSGVLHARPPVQFDEPLLVAQYLFSCSSEAKPCSELYMT